VKRRTAECSSSENYHASRTTSDEGYPGGSTIAAEAEMNDARWRICWTPYHFPTPIEQVRLDHVTPHRLLLSDPLMPKDLPF